MQELNLKIGIETRKREHGEGGACIGHLEGVTSACCGHGVEHGYIIKD